MAIHAEGAADRAVVVTGGGRGIGRAIAERLLDLGYRVVIVEPDTSTLDLTDRPTRQGSLVVVEGDAGHADVAARAADAAEKDGTGLAGWVNNAAVFRDAWLHLDDPEQVHELIEANLRLAVIGCAIAVRRMAAGGRGGAIVNVSSHQAQRPVRGALPYATAKAAIEGLTRAIAVDHGPQGIRANAVALGTVVTERLSAQFSKASRAQWSALERELASLHPLGRPGDAVEVANTVAFLLSDESSWITGAVLPVDGGRAAHGQDPETRATPDLHTPEV
jgi:NAD(P)-dependent dehydrogenase (short-subunit alcohol dehydrogenase family)